MSFGSTPLSTTPLGANQFPTSSVYVPNHAGGNLTAMRGGRASTDSSSNESAAGEVFTADLLGTATSISAVTTFSGIPSVSQLIVNSYVLLANPGGMATFLAELQTSAFVGTLSFYGLEPDGSKLQLISLHQRGSATIANSVSINVSSATNQVWAGSMAGFSAVYVVCTAFTSGSITVTPAMSAAVYAVSITNTVPTQDANSASILADLAALVALISGGRLLTSPPTIQRVDAQSGDFPAGSIVDLATLAGAISAGKMLTSETNSAGIKSDLDTLAAAITSAKMQANMAQVGGVAPKLDNTNELGVSLYGKQAAAGDTPLLVDASGRVYVNVNSLPALAAGSANIGGVEVIDSGGTNKLSVDSSGRVTVASVANQGFDNTDRLKASLYGKNSSAADTAIAVDSSGRMISIDQLRNAILSGQAWSCSTDFISASANMAGEFFVPSSSAKNVLIWSVRLSYTNANQFAWTRYITAVDTNIDTAGTSVIGNAFNLKGGGSAPASGATFKYNSGVTQPAISASTLPIAADPTALNAVYEAFATGEARLIPAGTAGGVACYHNTTAAGKWSMTVRFLEF